MSMKVFHREFQQTGIIDSAGAIHTNRLANVASLRSDSITVCHAARPFVAVYPNFLSPEECDHMISIGRPNLERSRMGGGGNIDYGSNGRTSSSAPIEKAQDEIVRRIEERAAYISGYPVDNIERLQVVRYRPGQQFDSHWDSFGPFNVTERDLAHVNGYNRVVTLFIYLTDAPECSHPDDEGHQGPLNGCTVFPLLSLAVPPARGTAVVWTNTDDNLRIHQAAMHQGFTVCCGEKWGLNVWVHRRELWTYATTMERMRAHVRRCAPSWVLLLWRE